MTSAHSPDFWRGEKVQLCALADTEAERFEDRIYFPVSCTEHRALLERLAAREDKGDTFFWVIRDLYGERVGTIISPATRALERSSTPS